MQYVEPHTLAIFGGNPTFPEGAPQWPQRNDDVRDSLLGAWEDGSWGQYRGPYGSQLVEELGDFHNVEYVMLTCSGTMAVELALRAVGVQPGDRVALAAYDFPGNFRAIEATGARPVLVDVSPHFVPSIELIQRAILEFGPITALLVSHLHGNLADLKAIVELADQHDISVVEDACQVPGAKVGERRAGAGGHVGVLSFGGSKLLSAGRGGALLFGDAITHQRAKVFSERGNEAFPMSELQAAVVLPQLRRLNSDNQHRATSVERIRTHCQQLPGLQLVTSEVAPSSFYKLAWRFDNALSPWKDRATLIQALAAEGFAVGEGFRGFARRSTRRCDKIGELRESQLAAEQTVLLHHPVLLEDSATVDRVIDGLRKVSSVQRLPTV